MSAFIDDGKRDLILMIQKPISFQESSCFLFCLDCHRHHTIYLSICNLFHKSDTVLCRRCDLFPTCHQIDVTQHEQLSYTLVCVRPKHIQGHSGQGHMETRGKGVPLLLHLAQHSGSLFAARSFLLGRVLQCKQRRLARK